jgi:hypothetical protein
MSCCGQQRAAWRTATQRTSVPPAAPVAPAPRNPVRLAHLGDTSTVVRGAVTGLTYLFGARGSMLEVDGADAEALLASRRFERR